MDTPIRVYRGRTNVIEVELSHQIGDDVYTSDIRVGRHPTSLLIARWVVSVKPGAANQTLILTLDDSVTADIVQSGGYTDLKRVSGGEPYPVFDYPKPVVFLSSVTA